MPRDTDLLYGLNTSTGELRLVESLMPAAAGHHWAALAWHLNEGQFYALSSNGADSAQLNSYSLAPVIEPVGSSGSAQRPLCTYYRQHRTQSIYLSSELEGVGAIDYLSLYVDQLQERPSSASPFTCGIRRRRIICRLNLGK